jgi:hypothetical protein
MEFRILGPLEAIEDGCAWGSKTRSACKFDVSGALARVLVPHAEATT